MARTIYLMEMFNPVAANPALRRNRSMDGDLIIQTVKNMSYGRRSFAIADHLFGTVCLLIFTVANF